jgi:hypothetical protein
MAVIATLAAGAAVSALGSALAGRRMGKAAESQAKAQQSALSRYAKSLRANASTMQGGLSQAAKDTAMAQGAMQRADEAQQARVELSRGGANPKVGVEKALGAAQQAGLAAQMQGIDQASQQAALQKAAERTNMQAQALQADLQAQSISPEAAKKGASAPYYGQALQGIGGAISQVGMAGVAPMAQMEGQTLGAARMQSGVSAGTITQEQMNTMLAAQSRGGQ